MPLPATDLLQSFFAKQIHYLWLHYLAEGDFADIQLYPKIQAGTQARFLA